MPNFFLQVRPLCSYFLEFGSGEQYFFKVMSLVRRDIQEKIRPWMREPQIILIKGARRSGKTTLLSLIKEEIEKEGKSTAYYAVDQLMHEPFWRNVPTFLNFLKGERDFSSSRPLFLMLDEIQYLDDPGLFLKVLYDLTVNQLKIIVTGSSALELSKTREFLPGRKIEFELERFSFSEFWRARISDRDSPIRLQRDDHVAIRNFYEAYKYRLESAFTEYLTWGGYPEVVLKNGREKKGLMLKNILNTYLERDVAALFHLSNISGFNNLIHILARQVGQLLNKKEISSTLGIHFQTLVSYLDLLSGTFIFDYVRPFYKNVRKELSKMPKIYARDIGIIQYAKPDHFTDYAMVDGHRVENFVYRQLLEYFEKKEIHFY